MFKNGFALLAYLNCTPVPRFNQSANRNYCLKTAFNVNTLSMNTIFCCARSVTLLC